MVVIPFSQRLKVPAHVVDFEVWPLPLDPLVLKFRELLKSEDAHITMAHEILPKSLNAVVWIGC